MNIYKLHIITVQFYFSPWLHLKNGAYFVVLLILAFNSGASAREARPRSTMGKKNGNSSSRENLVMTSAHERTPSVQTLGEEEGRLETSFTGDLKIGGVCQKFVFVVPVNDRGR